jgi:hypothetical protein
VIRHWLLMRLTDWMPAREIRGDHGEEYLERYYVIRAFGITAYLHRFLADDSDRGLHDHPWSWALSLILVGQYDEIRRDRTRRRRWVNWLRGDTFHRITLVPGTRICWTLFIHGPYVKPWGFLEPIVDDDRGNWKNCLMFVPFDYGGAGTHSQRGWYTRAPKGRELRRARGWS